MVDIFVANTKPKLRRKELREERRQDLRRKGVGRQEES
jgi:hypothetical protein